MRCDFAMGTKLSSILLNLLPLLFLLHHGSLAVGGGVRNRNFWTPKWVL